MLSDGLHAAVRFREAYPQMFEVLSRIPVEFYDRGTDEGNEFHIINRTSVIR